MHRRCEARLTARGSQQIDTGPRDICREKTAQPPRAEGFKGDTHELPGEAAGATPQTANARHHNPTQQGSRWKPHKRQLGRYGVNAPGAKT